MKRVLLVALSAGFLLAPTVASAQFAPVPEPTEFLQFVGVGDAVQSTFTNPRVYLGPYEGSFQGYAGSFAIYCVDYYHTAGSQQVASTSLADPAGDMGLTREKDFQTYQRAAYLSSLFENYEGHQHQRTIWSGLHAAIWSITSEADVGNDGATGWWKGEFLEMAENTPDGFGDGWYVLSGINGANGQEFLVRTPVSVPEPGTLLLMGSGIMMLVGVNRRRMKDVIDEA